MAAGTDSMFKGIGFVVVVDASGECSSDSASDELSSISAEASWKTSPAAVGVMEDEVYLKAHLVLP